MNIGIVIAFFKVVQYFLKLAYFNFQHLYFPFIESNAGASLLQLFDDSIFLHDLILSDTQFFFKVGNVFLIDFSERFRLLEHDSWLLRIARISKVIDLLLLLIDAALAATVGL